MFVLLKRLNFKFKHIFFLLETHVQKTMCNNVEINLGNIYKITRINKKIIIKFNLVAFGSYLKRNINQHNTKNANKIVIK